jgi:DNA-binding transcriptional ArsR family regulator
MATPQHSAGRRLASAHDGGGSPARLLKAFTHPLRVAILARLDEEVLSPKELAREFETSLPVVSYHVRELERTGLIELVRTAQRRGAVQHWYRAKVGEPIADRDWATMSVRARREVVGVALARLEAAIASASEQGGLDRADVRMSRETVELDEQGFEEVAALVAGVRERVQNISSAAKKRVASKGGEPLQATLSLMLFEGPDAKGRGRG